ncbi:HAD hydrolase-like protein [Candidatus Bathyarchaeota archaeon]|nr:HAD hydrolase-like protein [Candidatus Bathyarchaeota archaeon]
MALLIDQYFSKHLNLPYHEAKRLHGEYYTMYGLAIEGLVRHHEIDPLDYNAKVDDALPLQDIIKPDPGLRALLEDIDKDKVTMWLFTNAYVTHGRRVVKLLGVDDLFDGLTYCDYSGMPLLCKPSRGMYEKAMREAGVDKVEDCFFVGKRCLPLIRFGTETNKSPDDSFLNCSKAKEFGWTVAHLVEEGLPVPKKQASQYQIQSLQELRNTFPQFFKSAKPADA